MAAKTYAPQFARMLQRVARYYGRHQSKIESVATAAQTTDARLIVTTIPNNWGSVPTTEQP